MIIGLNGRKDAGKDACCERLDHLMSGSRPVKRIAFADPMKKAVAGLLGVTLEQVEEYKEMERRPVLATGENMRQFLQRYGMVHRALYGDSFWIDQAMLQMEPFPTLNVFTDVRLPNEAEAIRAEGGHIWCLTGVRQAHDSHVTELPLPPHLVDHTIINSIRDDDFAALDWSVRSALEVQAGIGVEL